MWNPEELTYFILMCDVNEPKYLNAARREWVPYAQNEYRWDKAVLSESAFERIASGYPKSSPRPFADADCDGVTLSYVDSRHVGAVRMDRRTSQAAVEAMIRVCGADARYVEFDYTWARHLFRSVLDVRKIAQLRSVPEVTEAFGQIHRGLVQELKTGAMIGRPVLLFCKEGNFERPITLWFEA